MSDPLHLGHVTAPSGVLALVDMGLLGGWRFEAEAHREALGAAVARGPSPFAIAGLEGVAIPGLPRDRAMPVVGVRLDGGEFANLWQAVFVEVQPGVEAVHTLEVGELVIDTERLLVADADALSAWVHDEAIDGRADFVFWGEAAKAAAEATSAADLGEGTFGFVDLAYDDAIEKGMDVEDWADEHGTELATDFRPHSHHHAMLSQMRESESESGSIELGPASLVALFTMWEGGRFPVLVDVDAEGRPTRFGVYLATKQAMMALHARRHASEFD
jgi:hypothetical protein